MKKVLFFLLPMVFFAMGAWATGSITGNSKICLGAKTDLVPSLNWGTWTSSNTSVATITSIGSIGRVSGVSVGTSTISYVVGGSTYTYDIEVVNNSLTAIATVISGLSPEVCEGSTIALVHSGGTWTSSNTWTATVSTTGVVMGGQVNHAPPTSESVYISNFAGAECAFIEVTINPLVAIHNVEHNLCVGQTFAMTTVPASAGGTWLSSNSARLTVDSATGVATGISEGCAQISYLISIGTDNNCLLNVAVTTPSTKIVLPVITGTLAACEGGTTTLSCTPSDALCESFYTGAWSSSNPDIAIVSSTGVVTGVSAGTVNISFIIGSDVLTTDTCYTYVTVTINPRPSAIAGTLDVCVGETTTLSSATAGGTWSSSHGAVATVDAAGIVTGVTSGTAVVTYMLTTGCFVTAIVTVHALPADITGTLTVCVGATTDLDCATEGGTWSSSATGIATVNSAGLVTGVAAGTANISYTTAAGCVRFVTVTVNPVPAAITGPAIVHIGLSITLANATSGGTWSSSNTGVATITTSGVVTGVSSGTTTITYVLSNGCYVTRLITVEPVFEIEVCEIDPIDICDSVFSYCDSFKLRVFKTSGSSAVDYFSWSPALPATVVFSGTEATFVFTAVPTSGTYTVTAHSGSYTTSARIRLVVASGGNYPCKQFKPLCKSGCDVVPFRTIWSTNLTNTHISEVTAQNYYLPYRSGLSYSLAVSPAPGSVFLSAPYVDMVVDTGKDVTLDSCHLFGDVAAGWWGIRVRVTATGTGKLRVSNNTLIENMNRAGYGAVEINPGTAGVSFPATGEILESNTAIWNHNNIGISITDINTLTGRPPFTVVNSVFTNRELCEYHTPGSTSCESYYPFAWPTVAYLKTMTYDTMTPRHVIDSFTEYHTGAIGILLRRVGKTTGSAPYSYNYMILGHTSNDTMVNMFDNMSDGVKVFTSNVVFYNNIFRKSGEGIDVQNYNEPFSILLNNGVADNTNNRFYNCVYGVSTGGIYHFRSRKTEMRSEYYSSNTNPYVYAAPGQYGFNIINSSTSGFDTIDIDSNSISNYLYGVYVNLPTAATICNGDVFVRNNSVTGITASDQYQYANTGIQLLGTGTCATATGTVKIINNHLRGLVNGITATSKNHLTHIDSNYVALLSNGTQYPHSRTGIRVIKGTSGIRSARIATIHANHIYGDTANGVNYRTPATTIETNANVVTGYKGIEVSLAGRWDYSNTISCNYIHDLNIAFSFLDSSYLIWKNNVIERAKYGMLIQRYKLPYGTPVPASIGVQGSPCDPSDNLWVTGSAAVGGWNDWGGIVGTDTAWQTYVSGMDPAAMNSRLHVRNTPGYKPQFNGRRHNGTYTGTAYTFGTSLDTSACDTTIGSASICGPYGDGMFGERSVNSNQPADGMKNMQQKDVFFTLYPNPSNGSLEIKHSSAIEGNLAITVRSYTGSVVYTGVLKMNNGISHVVLPGVVPGLYMVVVRDDEGHTSAYKVVIQ